VPLPQSSEGCPFEQSLPKHWLIATIQVVVHGYPILAMLRRMAKSKKKRVEQPEAVRHFASRLRELRRSRGLSQAELSRLATITPSYITRLENGSSAPNLDTLSRLAAALNVALTELLPANAPADPVQGLREQARRLALALIDGSDRETLLMLCPLLARLAEAPTHNH